MAALKKCTEIAVSGRNRTKPCIPCYPDATDDNGSSREMQLLVPPSVVSSSVISNRI